MSHMVIYRGSDGKPGYHQTDDIHDAVGFVEQMRNDQGVEHARIFRLEEVVFQYKPYYRVELAESGPSELAVDTTANSTDKGAGDEADNKAGSTLAVTNGEGDVKITTNGGGGNGSGDSAPVPAGTATASDSTGSADDAGSKRGLFGR